MELAFDRIDSPLGTIWLGAHDGRLCVVDFDDCRERMDALLRRRFGDVACRNRDDPFGLSSRLRDYFAGALEALEGLPVETGGTPFQRRVWNELRAIPVGRTASYAELAARIGRPSASRAVGLANALNPVALVVPCHRVVGSDGSLTGYAGGLERKRWLLRHEGAIGDASVSRRSEPLYSLTT